MLRADTTSLLPGATAQRMGFPADDPDADGLITAEDSYASGPLEFWKLTRAELPQDYLDRVRPQPA